MRAEAAQRRAALSENRAGAALGAESGDVMSRKIIEARGLTKTYTRDDGSELPIVRGLDLKILRGDRVGLIGPNGIGKTTLLRLLLGELAPDEGSVKVSKAIETVYLDQTRESLKPANTLWETLAPAGGDHIMVQGRSKHVTGYAKEFLFDPEQMRQPVSALSGGERNRLTLAVTLAKPCDLLVLDEPTNDLDMQTLDLLEEMLANYEGTLMLVSHDRAFLDATVTSCLVPEGSGVWRHVPGGWSDAVAQVPGLSSAGAKQRAKPKAKPAEKPAGERKSPTKLSFKDEHRLKEIDALLPRVTAQIAKLEAEMADPDLYAKDADGFQSRADTLSVLKAEKDQLEEDWLRIEAKREEFERS